MKKLFFFLFLVFLIGLVSVSSQEEIAPTPDKFTGTSYPHLNPSPLQSLFQAQTTVGGFRCSDSLDYHFRTTNNGKPYLLGSSGQLCFTSERNYVVQVWNWNPWKLLDEIKIEEGSGSNGFVCRTYTPNSEIDFGYYYCDIAQVTCQETSPYINIGCDFDKCGEGQVLRKREVQELVSGGCNNWQTEGCYPDTDYGVTCREEPTCVQVITAACNPSTKETKDFSTPCNVPSGWTTDLSQCETTPTNGNGLTWELDNLEAPSTMKWDEQGAAFLVEIFNKNDDGKTVKVEAVIVSRTSDYYKAIEPALQLQSVFTPRAGIELFSCPTDEKFKQQVEVTVEKGKSLTAIFSPKLPSSSSLIPSKFDDGSSNFNANGEYAIIVGAFEECGSAHISNVVGKKITLKKDFSVAEKENCNLERIDNDQDGFLPTNDADCGNPEPTTPEPKTISKNKGLSFQEIADATTSELFLNSCESRTDCEGKCLSYNALVRREVFTEKDVNDILDEITTATYFKNVGKGAAIGASVCAITGIGIPACATAGAGVGFLTTGIIDAFSRKNPADVGVCVLEEEIGDGGLGEIKLGSIGCKVGESLGLKDNECNTGWIITIFAVIVFLVILSNIFKKG